MRAKSRQKQPWKPLNWQHGIFGIKDHAYLSQVSLVWLLLRGITLWNTWVECNDRTFNNQRWGAKKKMQHMIWQGILKYSIIA